MNLNKSTIQNIIKKHQKPLDYVNICMAPLLPVFLFGGVIATPNPSVGPPFPILNNAILDHIENIIPTSKKGMDIIICKLILLIIFIPINVFVALFNL